MHTLYNTPYWQAGPTMGFWFFVLGAKSHFIQHFISRLTPWDVHTMDGANTLRLCACLLFRWPEAIYPGKWAGPRVVPVCTVVWRFNGLPTLPSRRLASYVCSDGGCTIIRHPEHLNPNNAKKKIIIINRWKKKYKP